MDQRDGWTNGETFIVHTHFNLDADLNPGIQDLIQVAIESAETPDAAREKLADSLRKLADGKVGLPNRESNAFAWDLVMAALESVDFESLADRYLYDRDDYEYKPTYSEK